MAFLPGYEWIFVVGFFNTFSSFLKNYDIMLDPLAHRLFGTELLAHMRRLAYPTISERTLRHSHVVRWSRSFYLLNLLIPRFPSNSISLSLVELLFRK